MLYKRTEHRVYRTDMESAGPWQVGPLRTRLTPANAPRERSHRTVRGHAAVSVIKPFFSTTTGAARKKEKLASPSGDRRGESSPGAEPGPMRAVCGVSAGLKIHFGSLFLQILMFNRTERSAIKGTVSEAIWLKK